MINVLQALIILFYSFHILMIIVLLGINSVFILELFRTKNFSNLKFDTTTTVVLGVVILVILSQLLSLFRILYPILLLLLYISLLSKNIRSHFLQFFDLTFLRKSPIIIAFTLLLVLRMKTQPTFIDSIETHIPLVNLLVTNTNMLGSGNVEPYMAYGTAAPYISALLYINVLSHNYYGLFNLIITMLFLVLFLKVTNLRSNLLLSHFYLFSFILLYSIVLLRSGAWLSTPNHDFPTAGIFLLASSYFIYISNKVFYESMYTPELTLFSVFLLVGVFRSQWIFWGVLFVLIYLILFNKKDKRIPYVLILMLLINLPSMLVRFIYTGHFLFPVTNTFFETPWMMTSEQVKLFMGSSQIQVAQAEFERGAFQSDLVLLIVLISIPISYLMKLIPGNNVQTISEQNRKKINVLFFLTSISILFWWTTIPIIRYIWGPFLILIVLNLFWLTSFIIFLNEKYQKNK